MSKESQILIDMFIKDTMTEQTTDERWNMAQDLVALLTDAGYDVIHADAINILERAGWKYPKSPWQPIDQERPETLPPLGADGISKIVTVSVYHAPGLKAEPPGAYRAWLEPDGDDFKWAVCYQELLGYEDLRDGDIVYAWQPLPDPAPYEVTK